MTGGLDRGGVAPLMAAPAACVGTTLSQYKKIQVGRFCYRKIVTVTGFCYRNSMNDIYCTRCHGLGHLSGHCTVDLKVARSPEKKSKSDGGCLHCGSTVEIFEDAVKWRRLRDKRRAYMRRRRGE
jgi:hypothetical protein